MDQTHPLYRHVRATQWSKGCSRDAFASQLNPGKFIKIRGVSPGPGQYQFKNKACGSDGHKWTMKKRTTNTQEPEYKMIKQDLPGPGNYGVDHNLGIGTNKIGKYYLSNMQNSRASVFSPTQRFRDTVSTASKMPGPGTYANADISVDGDKVRKYVLSNFKTNGVSRMVMPFRTVSNAKGGNAQETDRGSVKSRLDTPGPG
jgi:hypothetical protein